MAAALTPEQAEFLDNCRDGTLDDVRASLADGLLDVNVRDPDDSSFGALHLAARRGTREGDLILSYLLGRPFIFANRRSVNGGTALYWAAYNGCTGAMKILLDDPRVDVNLRDFQGRTALYVAAMSDEADAVMLLLANFRWSVDVGLIGHEPHEGLFTAKEIAEHYGNEDIVQVFDEFQADPGAMKLKYRLRFGLVKPSPLLFATVIFLCDGFLEITNN